MIKTKLTCSIAKAFSEKTFLSSFLLDFPTVLPNLQSCNCFCYSEEIKRRLVMDIFTRSWEWYKEATTVTYGHPVNIIFPKSFLFPVLALTYTKLCHFYETADGRYNCLFVNVPERSFTFLSLESHKA